MVSVTTIFVMPSEEGMPPRAALGVIEVDDEEAEPVPITVMDALANSDAMAVFSGDLGCWTLNGQPVPEELNDAISDHARSLGVPGF